MTMPTWLINRLKDQGLIGPGGTTRAARYRTHDCGAPILIALDADRCSRPVTADPTPLSATGELTALLTGRTTYALWYWGGRLEIDHRTSFHIRGTPAGTTDQFDVIADHRCGARQLDSIPTIHVRPARPPIGSEAPF